MTSRLVRALVLSVSLTAAFAARPVSMDVGLARDRQAVGDGRLAPDPSVEPAAEAVDDLLLELRKRLLETNADSDTLHSEAVAIATEVQEHVNTSIQQRRQPIEVQFKRWTQQVGSLRLRDVSPGWLAMISTNIFMLILMWRMWKEARAALHDSGLLISQAKLASDVQKDKIKLSSKVPSKESEAADAIYYSPMPPLEIALALSGDNTRDEYESDASVALSADALPIPESFKCPITKEIMNDPVTTVDGLTYERESILAWFRLGKRTSPLTNAALPSLVLTQNIALKSAISEFRRLRPELRQREMQRRDFEAAVDSWQTEVAELRQKCMDKEEMLEKREAEMKEQNFKMAMMEVAASSLTRRLASTDTGVSTTIATVDAGDPPLLEAASAPSIQWV